MTVGVASHAPNAEAGGRRRLNSVVMATAIALVVAGVGVAGYALGRLGTSNVQVLTGSAFVGDHVASVEVGGWTYGFERTVPMWIDASGAHHSFGWPDCLGRSGAKVPIRFGAIPVTLSDGSGMREVVWVDCRG